MQETRLGLYITVVDPDEDYLGIEICAANGKFAGATRIYAGLNELHDFAFRITGFPNHPDDKRVYEFGDRRRSYAGGYCLIKFGCLDRVGRVAVEVEIEGNDDNEKVQERTHLSIRTEAHAIDLFIDALRNVQDERCGVATLSAANY